MSADEWWARQQALRAKFLSTVRLLLDEEPALRGEDNKVRHSVEEFHRVLSQQHALSGEVPRCDMDKLLKYETTFDGLMTALRRTRELASAPPPAHAAPSPHPADAVQTPLEPVASPAPARAVEEEAEGADGADGADGAEGMEGVEGAEDWRAIHSAVRDVMYANGDAAAPLPACVRLLLDSLGRWQALLVAAARVERDGRASLCGKRLRQLHPGEHEAHRKMRPVQNTVSNTEASAIWRSGGGLHREPGRASGCPRLRPASVNQPLGRALAPRPSRAHSRDRHLQTLRRTAARAAAEDEEDEADGGALMADGGAAVAEEVEEASELLADRDERDRDRCEIRRSTPITLTLTLTLTLTPTPTRCEIRRFLDARTRDMGPAEYEAFARRRQAASLATTAFVRHVQAQHGLPGLIRDNGSLQPAATFAGRLATRHLGKLVEAANRAASGTATLTPPLQPLSLAHYKQALQQVAADAQTPNVLGPERPPVPGAVRILRGNPMN